MIVASGVAFVVGGVDESKLELTRLEFAKNIISIIEFGQKDVPMYSDPNYKLHNFLKNVELCTGYAVFADLTADKTERVKYLEKTLKLFKEITEFSKQRIINNQAFFLFCHCASRISVILAKNSEELSEQKNYYQMAIELLERALNMPFDFHRYDNLFFLGKIYHEFGKLLNDEQILKKSYLAYVNAIEFCKIRGFYSLVGSGYVHLAQLEDRLGNFLSAAENYQKAIESFDQALLILTFMNLGKEIENTKNYLNAWKLIEVAKSYHANEDHKNARIFYQQASDILQKLRDYRFESAFYIAWSELERAEELSKQNNHQDAAASYQKSTTLFQEAIEILNKFLKKSSSPEDKQRISNLIEVAKLRNSYCTARYCIETAKLESIQGNHIAAAEIYAKASMMFENLCEVYRIKKEKVELRAVYYLCKAWENLERGEVTQDASLHAKASELFLKASNITNENKIKRLSLGNSLYCSALESGIIFDNSLNLGEKMNHYKKIKMCLREAAKNYQMGGFEQDAKWALATSTFFDGIWQLIQSDNEINIANKNQYLNMAVNYLNSALNIFDEVGSVQKKENILKYLDMIKAEKAILASALDVIGKPTISGSSIGINAPACPVEISSSLNLDEMQKQDMQAESEKNWQKRIFHLYLYKPEAGVLIFDYPFQAEEISDKLCPAGLASASLAGISMIIQEVTKKETKLKILEQEDVTILLEYGKYLNGAL
ncbi:MAG: tetratricopeptide repeat protein, partial [Candidatus Helarchaeota archaeon]|nr:tetratricopeptide repeat protein [Candidatus Helarchaeota archaeon]